MHRYAQKSIVITGGILSGKSYLAKIFHKHGFKYLSVDKEAYKQMHSPEALTFLQRHCPNSIRPNGLIDKQKLADMLLNDAVLLKQWEQILHPLIKNHTHELISKSFKRSKRSIIIEIPLLFEARSMHKRHEYDVVITVTSSLRIRKRRIPQRKNMTEDKFHAILRKQCNDSQRLGKSDIVILNKGNRLASMKLIKQLTGYARKNKRNSAGY